MRLNVRVQPKAKQNKLVKEADRYKVYLTAPPVEGKANQALVDFLAEHFQVKRSQVKVIRGLKSRDKVIELPAK
jgi:uncharacterized protein